MGDMTPGMKIIGEVIRTSIVRNYEKEGRPEKWQKHGPATEARRGHNAAILRDSGRLMRSIHPSAKKDHVLVGTDTVYAAVHQFGARRGEFGTVTAQIKEHVLKVAGKQIKVRAHTRQMQAPWGDIPARPFLMVQDEDWDEIKLELNDYIMGG
jgi:phage virion morphogenesis protein